MSTTGTTGHKCQVSGIYQTHCEHRIRIALSKGDTFPPCRECGAVTWRLVQAA